MESIKAVRRRQTYTIYNSRHRGSSALRAYPPAVPHGIQSHNPIWDRALNKKAPCSLLILAADISGLEEFSL